MPDEIKNYSYTIQRYNELVVLTQLFEILVAERSLDTAESDT